MARIPRKLRSASVYQPLNRRHCVGELIQINKKQATSGFAGANQIGKPTAPGFPIHIDPSQHHGVKKIIEFKKTNSLVRPLRLPPAAAMDRSAPYTVKEKIA